MIKHMISKDPLERLTAKEYMNTYRGKLISALKFFSSTLATFLRFFFLKLIKVVLKNSCGLRANEDQLFNKKEKLHYIS